MRRLRDSPRRIFQRLAKPLRRWQTDVLMCVGYVYRHKIIRSVCLSLTVKYIQFGLCMCVCVYFIWCRFIGGLGSAALRGLTACVDAPELSQIILNEINSMVRCCARDWRRAIRLLDCRTQTVSRMVFFEIA